MGVSIHRSRGYRYPLLVLGWLAVGAGVVGIFLPLLPTVPFLLLALWCFSQSSERFHDWLYSHPRLGPPLQAWQQFGIISLRAKVTAVAVMALSFLYVTLAVAESWVLPVVVAAVLLPAAGFILTRPSAPPKRAATTGS